MLLQAVSFANSSNEVIIFAGKDDLKNKKMVNGIFDIYKPNMIATLVTDDNFNTIVKKMPYLAHFPKNYKDDPIVYVCENYTCKLPTSDLEKVIQLLSID